ncbi:RusA [uncultured Mediterranean phage uvMED]|nr:RusA [uncultured Mediterranean phage uvMED]
MRAFKNRISANNAEVLASWRSDVAAAAHRHKPEGWNIHAAVSLRCEFVFPRSKSHFSTAKGKEDQLLPSAPVHHTKTPDLDKLTRSIGDSLGEAVAQVLLKNDSQIVSIHATKRYQTDDFLGAIITVTALS